MGIAPDRFEMTECVRDRLPNRVLDGVFRIGERVVYPEAWRTYQAEDARTCLAEVGLDVDRLASEVDGRVASAFIRARKPLERNV